MRRATVEVSEVPVAGRSVRRIVLDCRHAVTEGLLVNGQAQHDIVRLLAARHATTCQCAAYLLAAGARA